jgi:hypothetical protein
MAGYTPNKGYLWKLCPFSQAYKEKYYDNGWDGNSNYGSLPVADSNITVHLTTSGTMNMGHRPGMAGWICLDDNCWYFTTYGKRYFEV